MKLMNLQDLITPERVRCNETIASKKRTLERLSELVANSEGAADKLTVFTSLIGRERLGSTGLGHGVALPHGRLEEQNVAIAAFVKLQQGIDFDASDQRPVDLVFALLVPEHFTDEHLRILAYLAEMFSDQGFCSQLRAAATHQALYELLINWQPIPLD